MGEWLDTSAGCGGYEREYLLGTAVSDVCCPCTWCVGVSECLMCWLWLAVVNSNRQLARRSLSEKRPCKIPKRQCFRKEVLTSVCVRCCGDEVVSNASHSLHDEPFKCISNQGCSSEWTRPDDRSGSCLLLCLSPCIQPKVTPKAIGQPTLAAVCSDTSQVQPAAAHANGIQLANKTTERQSKERAARVNNSKYRGIERSAPKRCLASRYSDVANASSPLPSGL
jgi:hypothetical protein